MYSNTIQITKYAKISTITENKMMWILIIKRVEIFFLAILISTF